MDAAVKVTRSDLLLSNEVLHQIDTVLVPGALRGLFRGMGGPVIVPGSVAMPNKSVAATIASLPELSTLATLLRKAGLMGMLGGRQLVLTIFAPANDAFVKRPALVMHNAHTTPTLHPHVHTAPHRRQRL